MHKPMTPPHIGERFGRLVVAGAPERVNGRLLCACVCECGVERIVRCENLRSGKTVSCSCHRKEAFGPNRHDRLIHGMSDSPEHRIWQGLIARCVKPKTTGYENYGGRGISVCSRWQFGENGLSGFQAFYADMGPRPSRDHSVEREDNEGDYEPGNVVWATRTQQNRNSRRNVFVEFRGQQLSLPDAVERWGKASLKCIHKRIRNGWSLERALLTPTRGNTR